MGTLSYDSSLIVEFDDRVLTHLQSVMGAKLRRYESFYFSWEDTPTIGTGSTTIWVHPGVALVFRYADGPASLLSRGWIDALTTSANSAGGLKIVAEPGVVTAV
jgi:hypothetical protein